MATRKAGRKGSRKAGRKTLRKNMMGGKRGGTPWTKFVKKMHTELKKKNPKASLGDAMKLASRRKSEM